MNPLEKDDCLDVLLQQENAYLADDGFTQQVIGSLPRRRQRRLPGILLLSSAIVGSIAAALFLPWNALPPLNVAAIFSLNFQFCLPWLTAILVVCSIAWAAVAAAQWDD